MGRSPLLIAVVDDEQSVRRALERLIRSAGYAADTFASGEAFLESLQERAPDCVVLDLHMPQMNGFEVQARLGQGNVRLPVIVITGHDTPEAHARAMAQGANVYLRKPVDDKLLLQAIDSAVAGERGHAA